MLFICIRCKKIPFKAIFEKFNFITERYELSLGLSTYLSPRFHSFLKRFFKILGGFILTILLVMTLILWLLTKEKYQNILVRKGTQYLSEKLHTKVSVKHIRISFLNHFNLEGVYIEDNKRDTLAYIGNLQLKTSELFSNYWNDSKPVIHDLTLEDVYINLNRKKDSVWNYDFIATALGSSSKDESNIPSAKNQESQNNPELDIKKLTCKNIRFFMNDGWRGEDMNFAFGSLILNAEQIDLAKKQISLKELLIDGADVAVREYDGYKPEDLTPDDTSSWGTPFNPDHYGLSLQSLQLNNSHFSYRVGNPVSESGLFDEKIS
ncbi:hypothetical protein EMGBS15_16780 [Filimonas sp.]|nr:hypothetical protein EMGBS15_16780 [Filimonas sp.]